MFAAKGQEKKLAAALAAVNGLGLIAPLAAPLAAAFEDNGAAEAAKIIKGGGQLVDRLYFKTAAAYTPTVSSGTVSGETLEYWQAQTVTDDGRANNTIISGGDQYVQSGGKADNTTINIGGQFVYAGGTASNTTLDAVPEYRAYQSVEGGTTYGTIIESGEYAEQNIYSGTANGTVINDGHQAIWTDGVANDTVINGGYQDAGTGTANNTTINGGYQKVGGGTANDTTINGGYQQVDLGGIANGTTISAGSQTVLDGGTANNTTISGGQQLVYDGGISSGTKIYDGGVQKVFTSGYYNNSGGADYNTTIFSGGKQEVDSGGTASGTTVQSGGKQTVASGGTAVSATVENGGLQAIDSGGTASGTTVQSGGKQTVASGGTAVSATVENGGLQAIDSGGTASGTTVQSGGKQTVASGGTAVNATVENGGLQAIDSGGTASGTTVQSGGKQTVASGGTAVSATVENGGLQAIDSGGTASSTTVQSGGKQTVSSGGTAVNATVENGGLQAIDSGGTASGTTVQSGGKQTVASGGTAVNATVENGGLQAIDSGGIASGTTVQSGGKQTVASGGTAVSATVENGGLQAIDSGGTASGTTVQSGGEQTVASGGIASGTTVQSGGKQTVANGGIISATVVASGGIQELAEGAVVDGNMTLSGTLEISTDSMDIGYTLLANEGSEVRFTSGGSAKTLTIAKLQGSTNFVINTNIVSGTSDKINIADASGSTNTVQIGYDPCFANGAGTTNASSGGVTFATVTSGGTANTFKAKETEYSAYKFTPTITNTSTTSGTEYKVASIFGEGGGNTSGGESGNTGTVVQAGSLVYTAGDAAGMALTAIRAENNNLTKRMGELRRSDKASGVWVRSYGGEQTVDTSIRRAEQNYHGLQGGYDKVKDLGNGKLFAGYTVGYLKATGDLERGDSDNSSLSLGLYGSWLGDKGHYFDIIAKRSRQNNSYRTYLDNGLNTRLDADYRTHGTTLGMEYGYRKELKDGYYLEPQAELIYSRIGGVDYKVSDGTEASQASIRSLIGRIGATYGKRTDHQNYYIKLSAVREFTAKERVRMHLGSMSAVGMEESLKESWLEIALGLTGTAGRNSDYYVELTKTTGDKVKEDWQASVGMRWKF